MSEEKTASAESMDAIELVAICGFAFFFGWMLLAFYWLSAVFLETDSNFQQDASVFLVFVGALCGYLILHCIGRNARIKFDSRLLGCLAAPLFLQPVCILLMACGVAIPWAVTGVVNLLTGVGGAFVTVSWLHVASGLRVSNYGRLVGVSIVGGGIIFALTGLLPEMAQPVVCLICAFATVFLMAFVSVRCVGSSDAIDESEVPKWEHTKEIAPSFVAFSIVFAMTFVFLFNYGLTDVYFGLASVIVGAGVIAIVSVVADEHFDITILQRILLVIAVFSCLVIPFAPMFAKLVCSCLITASWAALMTANYSLVIRKCLNRNQVVFWGVPIRLVPTAMGFAIGWCLSTITTFFQSDGGNELFTVTRLAMVFILVLVVTAFPSESRHHDEDSSVEDEPAPQVISSSLSESELFDRRCDEVARLYQLSPRETDILRFLAKGRNAAYIQNKLTISPHTVKSHIYSIYRKTDIHSQQSLMDFVEEFPLDESAIKKA